MACGYYYGRVMTPDFRWVTWSASTWSAWRTEGWDLTEPGHLAGFSQQCNQCNLLDQLLALRTKASSKLRCGRIRGRSFGEAEALDWKSVKLWGSPDWVREQTLKLLKKADFRERGVITARLYLISHFDNLSYNSFSCRISNFLEGL